MVYLKPVLPSSLPQIRWRLSDEPIAVDADEDHKDPGFRGNCRTKIYLGYTSNLISAGVREQIRYEDLARLI